MIQKSPLQPLLSLISPGWSGQRMAPLCSIPADWRSSLFSTGSLTAELIRVAKGDFHVEVLAQGWRKLSAGEAQLLGLATRNQTAWTRDVALCVNGSPWVYARTCIPASTLTGAEKRLLNLGNKPLGAYLFQHPAMKRGKMTAARIGDNALGIRWARRSVFFLYNKPLLVSEAFVRPLPKD